MMSVAVSATPASTEASWRSWSKGSRASSLVHSSAVPRLDACSLLHGGPRPQGHVQGVAAHRSLVGHGRLVADQPEDERESRPAGRTDLAPRSKVMTPSVRVPVLSVNSTWMLPRSSMVTSRFDEDPTFAGQGPRPTRQAHADDGREQLRRDADGDGEGEQQRLDDRARQHDVDDEDRGRQHRRHLRRRLGEVPESPPGRRSRPDGRPSPTTILPKAVAEPVEGRPPPRPEP